MNTHQWKKAMLAAPNLAMLRTTLAMLQEPAFIGTLQQALGRTISMDHFANVESTPGANLVRDSAVNDVRGEYIYQIRILCFGAENTVSLPAWWFAGNRKSDRASRIKALERFIQATIDAGRTQNRVFKAYLDGSTPRVVEAQQVETTKGTITVRFDSGLQRMERINGPAHAWRDTWEEASQVLMAFARERLEDARRALQSAQAYDGNCRGLKRKAVVLSETEVPPSKLTAAMSEILGTDSPAKETPAVAAETKPALTAAPAESGMNSGDLIAAMMRDGAGS